MPKSRIFRIDYALKSITDSLQGWARHRDKSPAQMGVAMHFSATTWYERMKHPEKLTIAEIWRAVEYLKIPADEAVSLLTAGIETRQK